MTISAVLSVRNTIETGYPFMESILSVLPVVDEYLLNDGGSTDGTAECLKRLQETFPDKIRLFNIKDYRSDRWECVNDQYNHMYSEAKGDWFFEGQGDELIHEKDIKKLPRYMSFTKADVLRFPRGEVNLLWNNLSTSYWAARAARNIEGMCQMWPSHGGDEWLTVISGKHRWLRDPPECKKLLDLLIWHLYVIFPATILAKRRNDALYIATKDEARIAAYERIKVLPERRHTATECLLAIPALARGLVGWRKYRVREELFDKSWLKKTTGLEY